MCMVSMMTYFLSVRGLGHPVFLKPYFGHPAMKMAKTLSQSYIYKALYIILLKTVRPVKIQIQTRPLVWSSWHCVGGS